MKRTTLHCLRELISRIVNPPQKGMASRFWPREMKLAKELFEKMPDEIFWSKVQFGFKLNSLAWLKTKNGEDTLTRKYKEFHYQVPERKEDKVEISDGKFGETLYNSKPKRFLSDFLR